MRTMMRRGLVAGAVALAISMPAGAFAANGPDDDPSQATRQYGYGTRECVPPDEVRELLQSQEMVQLREQYRADVAALREQYRAGETTREDHLAAVEQLRERYREQVTEMLGDSPEALEWVEEHWGDMGDRGPRALGQGMKAKYGAQGDQRRAAWDS